mgnify:CR=1 FL=1
MSLDFNYTNTMDYGEFTNDIGQINKFVEYTNGNDCSNYKSQVSTSYQEIAQVDHDYDDGVSFYHDDKMGLCMTLHGVDDLQDTRVYATFYIKDYDYQTNSGDVVLHTVCDASTDQIYYEYEVLK